MRARYFYALAAAALLAVAVATLTLGDLGIPLQKLPAALSGDATGKAAFVMERLRGPRLAAALLAGALFGVAGALFQSVNANPLGSPDVIGLGAGAGAGVAVTTLLLPAVPASLGAVAGAAVATGLVFLSTGVGFRSPTRTIIAGIGVAALAYAITHYVVSVQLRDAGSQLAAFVVGSLASTTLADVAVVAIATVVLLPVALSISADITILEIGDEAASGVGVNPDRTRTLAVVLSVLASGAAVAGAGPIAFVALTAPQIARRILATSSVSVLPSALTGALILAVSDLAVQQVPLFSGLPAGVLTLGVGGVFLGYLLVAEHSKGRL